MNTGDPRASGTGFAIGAGRGGSVRAPIIAGFLFQAGFLLPTVSFALGAGSIFGAVMLLLLKLEDRATDESETAIVSAKSTVPLGCWSTAAVEGCAGLAEGGSVSDDKRFRSDASAFRAPRFQALYRGGVGAAIHLDKRFGQEEPRGDAPGRVGQRALQVLDGFGVASATPAPLRPRPEGRSGAVAVMEPDE